MEIIIKLTKEESEEYFFNALCNGGGELAGYGFSLDYSDEDYRKAKENLIKAGKENSICQEDVWMQILRDGGKLTFEDIEDEGENTQSITLEDVHNRVNETDSEWLIQMRDEEDDATTADCILQTVIFGEVVYG